jgi:hypothetical protein
MARQAGIEKDLLAMALLGYEAQKTWINAAISDIQAQLGHRAPGRPRATHRCCPEEALGRCEEAGQERGEACEEAQDECGGSQEDWGGHAQAVGGLSQGGSEKDQASGEGCLTEIRNGGCFVKYRAPF